MEGQVIELVDRLAEKLGVAVEKVVPVLEEAMRQAVLRSTIYAIGTGTVVIDRDRDRRVRRHADGVYSQRQGQQEQGRDSALYR